jgi:hypothetical protein
VLLSLKQNQRWTNIMMPISEIKVGQQYQTRAYADGVVFCVEDVNTKEKMVKVQGYSPRTLKPVGGPFWKKNTDRMFSEPQMIFDDIMRDELGALDAQPQPDAAAMSAEQTLKRVDEICLEMFRVDEAIQYDAASITDLRDLLHDLSGVLMSSRNKQQASPPQDAVSVEQAAEWIFEECVGRDDFDHDKAVSIIQSACDAAAESARQEAQTERLEAERINFKKANLDLCQQIQDWRGRYYEAEQQWQQEREQLRSTLGLAIESFEWIENVAKDRDVVQTAREQQEFLEVALNATAPRQSGEGEAS